jgi:hypothetical protein
MLDSKWYTVAQTLETAMNKKFKKRVEGEDEEDDEEVIRYESNSRE